MTHIEEFKKEGTIFAWTEQQILDGETSWGIELRLKDAKGLASLEDQMVIEIDGLLGYNNVEHISEEEVRQTVKKIMSLAVILPKL